MTEAAAVEAAVRRTEDEYIKCAEFISRIW